MLFEGNNNILVIPRVSGENPEVYFNRGYTIVNREINDVEDLNKELREVTREMNTKYLNLKYF
jgi:hypothetical protein